MSPLFRKKPVNKTAALSEPETAWTAPRSDSQPLTAVSGPELRPCDSDATSGPEDWTEREARYIGAMVLDLDLTLNQSARAVLGRILALADEEAVQSEANWQEESDARDQDFADHVAALVAKDATIAYLNDEMGTILTAWDETMDDLDEARATIARMRTGRA